MKENGQRNGGLLVLKGGKEPQAGKGGSTSGGSGDSNAPEVPFEPYFVQSYELLKQYSTKEVGTAVVAVHVERDSRVSFWSPRVQDSPSSVIVGQHPSADLVLGCRTLELRHLAVLTPPCGQRPGEFSLHDLNTASAMSLEDGTEVRGLMVTRFCAIRLGDYVAFIFATNPAECWVESGEEMWARLDAEKEVQLSEEDYAGASQASRRARTKALIEPVAGAGNEDCSTVVCVLSAARVSAEALLTEGERPLAELTVNSEYAERFYLGERALACGVLLGRTGSSIVDLKPKAISRVHLLVIRMDGEIIGVDTGSTNEVFRELPTESDEFIEPVRVVRFSRGEFAVLSDGDAIVSVRDLSGGDRQLGQAEAGPSEEE